MSKPQKPEPQNRRNVPSAPLDAAKIDALLDDITPPMPDDLAAETDVAWTTITFVGGPKNGTKDTVPLASTTERIVNGPNTSYLGVYEFDHSTGLAAWCPYDPSAPELDDGVDMF